MNAHDPSRARDDAIARAERSSPFLRESLLVRPDLRDCFREAGAAAAAAAAREPGDEAIEDRLRRERRGVALAVALGDLAGELSFEQATGLLSDFADRAIDDAVHAALAERVPGAPGEGFSVIALGKLGSRELNYSSDVDLMLLFDPAALPRRERDDPADAAVRVGRRVIELLQKRLGA